jgi:hypothetical protein
MQPTYSNFYHSLQAASRGKERGGRQQKYRVHNMISYRLNTAFHSQRIRTTCSCGLTPHIPMRAYVSGKRTSSNGSGWVQLLVTFIMHNGLKGIPDFLKFICPRALLSVNCTPRATLSVNGRKKKSLVWPWPKNMPDIFTYVRPRAFLWDLQSLR